MRQWQRLGEAYASLGHTVRTITPEPGLPDMVFAANGATVIGGKVLGARFRYRRAPARGGRLPELVPRAGLRPRSASRRSMNEGEGDIVFAGRAILAGHGFRSDEAVRRRADRALRPAGDQPAAGRSAVLPPRHRLVVLDADTAAYYPAAFDDARRAALAAHFAELIEVKDEDAEVLGLNAISDGRNVVLPAQATGLQASWPRRASRPSGWTCRSC